MGLGFFRAGLKGLGVLDSKGPGLRRCILCLQGAPPEQSGLKPLDKPTIYLRLRKPSQAFAKSPILLAKEDTLNYIEDPTEKTSAYSFIKGSWAFWAQVS